jgi:hypothetical membrane protein
LFASASLSRIARVRVADHALHRVAAASLAVFVACLVAEHLLSPSLDPARHEISEYVHGSNGWLMTVGFVAWAVSLAASAASVWHSLRSRALSALLVVAAIALVAVTLFPTQTSAGALPPNVSLSTTGRLHDIGSGLASVALLAVAIVSVFERQLPSPFRRTAAALVVFAVLSDAVLLAVGASVGGIRQRLLVLIGVAWQIALGQRCAIEGGRTDKPRPLALPLAV